MEKTKKEYVDIENIKTLMQSKGIDEKEFARRMSVSLKTIKKFLNGADQKRMRGIALYKLAKAFDVSSQSLIHKDYL